jgi:hypothetical protein
MPSVRRASPQLVGRLDERVLLFEPMLATAEVAIEKAKLHNIIVFETCASGIRGAIGQGKPTPAHDNAP